MTAHITLVLGGMRSGKSAVAERLVGRSGATVTYVAPMVADAEDTDLQKRLDLHRERRPAEWELIECGTDLASAVLETTGSLVVDSLGSWLVAHDDMHVDVDGLLAALRASAAEVIVVVSEEVGLSPHAPSELGRRFQDRLGLLNQAVAELADEALLVVAGRVLPLDRLVDPA